MDNLLANLKEIADKQDESNKDKGNTSNRIDGLAAAHAKITKELNKEIEDLGPNVKSECGNHSA